ncbi:hypothetical protein DSL64_03340 [Dyadobacter luteus]|uniref:Right handed beta helix domain-containing protein n=1 Tax=Dyadobacter luteus TaxID=2259619 RepID=A0A3D8YFP0_9BACT|nr:right-handed parallel beta-helix repeat-containing protein [Dyadobacter luteus]REA63495.1 hypothetical protein DSL64_03340 [Dyadobacter luteus]
MYKKHFTPTLLYLALLLLTTLQSFGNPKIDPIRFSIGTKAAQVSLNEEFEITISAKYLNIPPGSAFVFEGSNSFKLKVVMPSGFVQTGGDFQDFIGTELTKGKTSASYTIKGKFVSTGQDGTFQLLRSHKNSDNQSTFIEVGRLNFNVNSGEELPDNRTARIMLAGTPGYVPYMTMAELRSGLADTAKAVYISEGARSGLFKYDPSNLSSADDSSLVLRNGTKRYVRDYVGPADVRWFGIVGDGVTDEHVKWDRMLLSSASSFYFPPTVGNVPYRIKKIVIPSNKKLIFADNVKVHGMGNRVNGEFMVMMYDKRNITIIGKNVIFSDIKANYTSGEQRHMFLMQGASNIHIEGIAANDGGGDGFYIGSGSQKYSENITLINCSADNNRRQGLSIISGKNITIDNCIFSNTKGTAPGAGIDIEPNYSDEVLTGIRIINAKTVNNEGAGLVLALGALANSGTFVDILVTGHNDQGSFYGALVSKGQGVLKGSIIIENSTWSNNTYSGFVANNYGIGFPRVVLNQCTAYNSNTINNTSPILGSAMRVYREDNEAGDQYIGNIKFVYPHIIDNRATRQVQKGIACQDTQAGGLIKAVQIIDAKQEGIPTDLHFTTTGEISIIDNFEHNIFDMGTGNRTVAFYNYARFWHNKTSLGPRDLTLFKAWTGFPDVTVEVTSANKITIIPDATDSILPLSPTVGKKVSSSTVGSRITLSKKSADSWFIKEMIGPWVVEP